ncbi:hypothetical protein B9Z55_000789 [Caenorhabditis nigoni]|uniref:Uncharacterized protein n=1 Tax=Caenorhabditis nigoni TaxID=1611254 RepID=A0A2G5VUT7_9PELO|nr:hypothetical protein B9Z55_000789 [Caenorhabditis nigoni]
MGLFSAKQSSKLLVFSLCRKSGRSLFGNFAKTKSDEKIFFTKPKCSKKNCFETEMRCRRSVTFMKCFAMGRVCIQLDFLLIFSQFSIVKIYFHRFYWFFYSLSTIFTF